ncbi:transcription factor TFIIIB component B'' homolog [Discoglossus pictus]
MIRRARLNFKPNVRPGGRAPALGGGTAEKDGAGAPTEAAPPPEITGNGEISHTPSGESSMGPPMEREEPPDPEAAGLPEKTIRASDEIKPSQPPTSTPLQRRKRISTLPNLAKPRVSISAAISPVQKASQSEIHPSPPPPCSISPQKTLVAEPEKKKIQSSPKSPTLNGARSPTINGASQVQHISLPEKRTPVPQVPQFSPYKKSVFKYPEASSSKTESFQKEEMCPLKERPSQKSCINEELSCIPKFTPVKKKVYNLELERLRRAQKLRDLLKAELKKERKAWKEKHPATYTNIEPQREKMVMRDFVHFIPSSNPMTSTLEVKKSSEKSPPTDTQISGSETKNIPGDEEKDPDDEENDSQLVVPRVKVAEDGTIILDEESLTVEVVRAKAAIVENNDPIFERGSSTTYSSFRRNCYSKPWSKQETEMFFLAISMVGTDFSMIGQLFPHRQRIEIKNKFKREERANGWRIDKAFREKKAFDFEFFATLLERALAEEKKQNDIQNSRSHNCKQADEQAINLSDAEAAGLSEGESADARTAEKENEESLSVTVDLTSLDPAPAKKRRTRKKKDNGTKEAEVENHLEGQSELPKLSKKERKPSKKRKVSVEEESSHEDPKDQTTENGEDLGLEEVPSGKKRRARKKKGDAKESAVECTVDTEPLSRKRKSNRKESSRALEDTVELDSDDDNAENRICGQKEEPVRGAKKGQGTEDDSCMGLEELFCRLTDGHESDELFSDKSFEDIEEETNPMDCGNEVQSLKSEVRDCAPAITLHPEAMESSEDECSKPELSKTGMGNAFVHGESQMEEETLPADSTEEYVEVSAKSNAANISPEDVSTVVQEAEGEAEMELSQEEHRPSSFQPAPKARGRLQQAKPILPGTSARKKQDVKEDTQKERNELATAHRDDTSMIVNSEHQEDEVFSSSQIPSDMKKDSSDKFSESAPPLSGEAGSSSCDLGQKDISSELKSSPSVRGRLLRPKPNLAKVPVKRKPAAQGQPTETCPAANAEDAGEIDGRCLPAKIPPEEEPAVGQGVGDENKNKDSSASLDESRLPTIKPAPLARGRLQRPKPNLTKAPTRAGKPEDREDLKEAAAENTSEIHQEDVFVNVPDKSLVPKMSADKCRVEDEQVEIGDKINESTSQDEHRQSPIKPAPLARGRLQRPKPNLAKASRTEKTEAKEDLKKERKEDTATFGNHQDQEIEVSTKDEICRPQDFASVQHSQNDSCSASSLIKETGPGGLVQEGSTKENTVVANEMSGSQEDTKPAQIKPAVLTRGRLQRPKPNLARASAKKDVLTSSETTKKATSEDEKDSSVKLQAESPPSPGSKHLTSEEHNVSSPTKVHKVCTNSPRSAAVSFNSPKQETLHHEGPLTVVEVVNEDASLRLLDHTKESTDEPPALENTNSQEEKRSESLKPAVLPRGRFQRPKPNLGRATTRKDLPSKTEMCEDGKEKGSDHTPPITKTEDTAPTSKSPSVEKSPVEGAQSCQLKDGASMSVSGEGAQDNTTVEVLEEEDRPTHTTAVRGRLQRPKPNLLRSVGRKAASPVIRPTEDLKTQGNHQTDSAIELPSTEDKTASSPKISSDCSTKAGDGDIAPAARSTLADTDSSINEESSGSTVIKPAPLKRGRLIRPKPNFAKASCKREGQLEDKPTMQMNSDGGSLEESPTIASPSALTRSERPAADLSSTDPKRKAAADGMKETSPKRSRASEAAQMSPCSSHEMNNTSTDSAPQRSRFGRLLSKPLPESRNTELVPEKEKAVKSVKPNKNKVPKPVAKQVKGKTTLVKLRASEREEEEDDDADVDFEDESYNLSPDKMNQAPVFIPFSLRSPKPVPAEIEETVEELEIPMEVFEVQHIIEHGQQVSLEYEETKWSPTEDLAQNAPMSPAHQDNGGTSPSSDHDTKNDLASNTENQINQEQSINHHSPSRTGYTKEEPLSDRKPDVNASELSMSPCSVRIPRLIFPKTEPAAVSEGAECSSTEQNEKTDAGEKHSHPIKSPSPQDLSKETPGLQSSIEVNRSICPDNSEEDQPIVYALECLPSQVSDQSFFEQSTTLFSATCTEHFEQNEESNRQEEMQQNCVVSLNDGISDNTAVDNCVPEEATFILTLVEIPINPECPYTCEPLSTIEPLPAPVLLSSGQTQTEQEHRTESPVTVLPSSERSSPSSAEVDSVRTLNHVARKRNASGSEEAPSHKKNLLDNSVKKEHKDGDNPIENRSERTSAYVALGMSSAELVQEENGESSRDQNSSGAFTIREKMLCDNSAEDESYTDMEQSGKDSNDLLIKREAISSPTDFSFSPPSEKKLQRPGRKPLGFLPLVCTDKKTAKKSDSKTAKKNMPKPNCKKMSTPDCKSQRNIPTPNQEDTTSNQVPSPSASASSSLSATTDPTHDETSMPSSEVSDNPAVEQKDTSFTSSYVPSEEEETTISEYFFSDIFMQVDDE